VYKVALAFVILFCAVGRPLAAEQPAAAVAAVERLDRAILESLRKPEASAFDERVALLRPIMTAAFDYDYMARVAAGRGWKDMSAAEQAEYRQLFEDLAIFTAASRFKAQPNAGLSVTGGRGGPRGTQLVETTLTLPGKKDRKIAYLMRQDSGDSWRAIDIFFDNKVSELSTKRSEYSSLIQKDGVEGFLAVLREKRDGYEEEE